MGLMAMGFSKRVPEVSIINVPLKELKPVLAISTVMGILLVWGVPMVNEAFISSGFKILIKVLMGAGIFGLEMCMV